MTDKEKLIEAQDKIIELQKKVIELQEANQSLRKQLQEKAMPYDWWNHQIYVDNTNPNISWSTNLTNEENKTAIHLTTDGITVTKPIKIEC